MTREVAALKPYADFQATAQTRIATVHDLATQRFDWEHALREMARAIPSNVTVKKLSGSVSADAGSDSPLRGAITAPAVTIDGCTRDQESVAVLMSRLRTVSGVTRVSLAKSTKPDPAQGGAAAEAADGAPAGSTTVVAGCSGKGKDQPPDFQVVAFFEDDAAATVAATPVTPGAPTAPQDAASATKPPTDGAVEDAADGKTASTDKGAE